MRTNALGPLDPIFDQEKKTQAFFAVGNTPPTDIFPTGGNTSVDEYCALDDVTYRYLIFTSNGTLTWSGPARSCQVLLVGGGAGSGGGRSLINGDAGGSGGEGFFGTTVISGDQAVTIGAGGTFVNGGGTGIPGNPGGTTTLGTIG